MNLFPEQISAAGSRQLEAQLNLLRTASSSAFDGAEKLVALQFDATRGVLEQSTELLRQIATAKDPRDLFALAKQGSTQFDNLMAYQRKLLGIASSMSNSVAGLHLLTPVISPTASAALQKLADMPAVASTVVDASAAVAEQLAGQVDDAAEAQVQAAVAVEDDIIETTNQVVEALAEESAETDAAIVADGGAPTAEPQAQPVAEAIAELNPVAAAAGHAAPRPSAAPFTVASADTPIEVQQLEAEQVPALEATPPVSTSKPAGRSRRK